MFTFKETTILVFMALGNFCGLYFLCRSIFGTFGTPKKIKEIEKRLDRLEKDCEINFKIFRD